ncbi:unnamed protein product [Linum trigynum]|uniref:Peptidase A1 domain-containing protein n=1 Tax=Linum trigynum TaxID=586398 RepID=A0AAV2CSY4_9ROSI
MRALNLFVILFLLIATSSSHGLKITTRLIHRDSRFSPLYNATATAADRAERSVQASLARHAYLAGHASLISSTTATSSDEDTVNIEAPLVPVIDHASFYVNFSIGDPPVPQLAIMDTGSSFTWVKCLPCTPCSSGSGAVAPFDPSLSKTYSARACTSQCRRCTTGGKVPSHCMYTLDYLGGDHSEGVYSTEQFTFRTSDDGIATVPDVQFGCCTNLTGTNPFHKILTGIFALGGIQKMSYGETPLVVKLGSVFSYCVGDVFDHSYPYNRLSIGAGDADLAGDSTPFRTNDLGHYFLRLQNISLGGEVLGIPSQVFANISDVQGILIDSGSELSFLYSAAYDVVKAEVQKRASSVLTEVWGRRGMELCYSGSVSKEGRGFPALGLHFADGAELVVESSGMFIPAGDGVFCLAVVRSESFNIVGMMAQQGYNVGYDLNESRVYFQDIDCQLLEG